MFNNNNTIIIIMGEFAKHECICLFAIPLVAK